MALFPLSPHALFMPAYGMGEEVYGAWFGASLTPASSKCGIRVVAACMICKRLLPAYGGRITATVYAPRYGTVIRPEPSEFLVPSRVVSPDNGQGLGPSYSSRVYRIRPDCTFLAFLSLVRVRPICRGEPAHPPLR